MWQVLACAIHWPGARNGASWYNLFSILFFAAAAVPPALCGRSGQADPFDEGGSAWPDVAFFLTGALATSGYALSAVLLGAGVLPYQTLVMGIVASFVLTLAVVVILRFVLAGSSHSELESW